MGDGGYVSSFLELEGWEVGGKYSVSLAGLVLGVFLEVPPIAVASNIVDKDARRYFFSLSVLLSISPTPLVVGWSFFWMLRCEGTDEPLRVSNGTLNAAERTLTREGVKVRDVPWD